MTGRISRLRRSRLGERTPAAAHEADERITEALIELEGATNYAAWIADLVVPHLSGRILELGAGRGTYSAALVAGGTSLTALEPSPTQAAAARDRLAAHEAVEVVEGELDGSTPPGYDSFVALNVLEHIGDDRAALREAHRVLVPGGRLVLWVPAFDLLYGDFDRRIGHFRRYRRRGLQHLVESSGFRVDVLHHANLPGFFGWLLVVRLLRLTPTASGLTRLYDRRVVPLVRWIEAWHRPPFGQSLFLVATRA